MQCGRSDKDQNWFPGFHGLRLNQCSDSPGIFGDARIVQNLHGGGGAEVLPVLQDPDDFFVRRDFDELRTFAVAAARAEDGVAVGQARAGLRRWMKPICLRQIGPCLNSQTVSPLGFTSRVSLSRFVGDERVAVLQANGGPRRAGSW